MAGGDNGTGNSNAHEQYNGQSWSEQQTLIRQLDIFGGTGSSTSAIMVGGYNPSAGVLGNSNAWNNLERFCWTEDSRIKYR